MDWIPHFDWITKIMMALFATYVLYFFFKKTNELSKHAAQNTGATLVVAFTNIIALWVFVDDVNMFAQRLYHSLGIPRLPADTWDKLPVWLVALIGIAAKDFVDYWNHRLMHTKWGWPAHAAHHSDTHVNAFTGFRIHFLEVLVMSFSYIALLTWLQMPQVLPIVALFYAFIGMYVHMDLDFDHGPFKYVLASPNYHRWHHADVPAAYGKNLANVIPFWDLIFGTYYNPGKCDAEMGALKSGIEDKNPVAIYLYPALEWTRLTKSAIARRREKRRSKESEMLSSAVQKVGK